MKTKHSTLKLAVIGLGLATLTGIMAFQDSTITRSQNITVDTLPDNRNIHIDIDMKDLDKAMKELDVQLNKMGEQFKAIDWNKISKNISEELKKVDIAKIELEIKNSLKDINFDHVKIEIERSMKDLKEMDFNNEEIKKEMDKAKEEMKKAKEEMKKAKVEMNVAKEEMNNIKEMVSEMEKDKLIDTKRSYNIEYKDQELFINGKKQPSDVKEKYRKYIKGENFKLSRTGDGALALPPCSGLWISAYI